jgi:hypothetical protein
VRSAHGGVDVGLAELRDDQRVAAGVARPQAGTGTNRSGSGVQEVQEVQGFRPAPFPSSTFKYVAFEDQFRGSREAIRADGASNIVDVGCSAGVPGTAQGQESQRIDLNLEMVEAARAARYPR